jgi:hypothetical protein
MVRKPGSDFGVVEHHRGVHNAYSGGTCNDHLIELWARTG